MKTDRKLAEIMPKRSGSVDPSKYQEETFDLLSIPAFDSGEPEKVKGKEIGSSKKQVLPGDVLLSRIVPHIRRCWVVPELRGNRQIASSEWIIFRGEYFDPYYLRHYLQSDVFHVQFMRTVAGVGGSLLRARPAHVEKISFPCPSLPEQKRIADILDKADAVRRKRQEALRLADDFLKSTFLEMFGDPVTNPMGWEVKPLDDVADILTGYAFKSNDYLPAGAGLRLCRGANVFPGKLDWSDRVDWPETDLAEKDRFILKIGDITIAMDRPWISTGFKMAMVASDDLPSLLVQRVSRIRAEGTFTNQYLFQLLNTPAFSRHCSPTETTVPHISPIELRNFKVLSPPADLISRFTKICSYELDAVQNRRKQAQKSDDLFNALSQKAFQGEL